MAAAQEKFMSICGLEDYKFKSFEEARVDDYLKAYTLTGKPPLPCPEHPTTDMERAALQLPPLFQPYPVPSTSPSSTLVPAQGAGGVSPGKPSIKNSTDLPIGQEFTPEKVDLECYQSISCMSEFAFFSPEELRYYAYLAGHKVPPLSVKMDPFAKSVSHTTQIGTSSSPPEILQNIFAQPEFADHSFEELRVYYLLAGREVNSNEIRQFLGQPAVAASPPEPVVAPIQQPLTLLGIPGPSTPSIFSPSTLSSSLMIQPKTTPSFSFKF